MTALDVATGEDDDGYYDIDPTEESGYHYPEIGPAQRLPSLAETPGPPLMPFTDWGANPDGTRPDPGWWTNQRWWLAYADQWRPQQLQKAATAAAAARGWLPPLPIRRR